MKVKVIYRNYIPLYSAYCSFWLDKIPGVEIEIPPVKGNLKTLYKIYRRISKFPFVPKLVEIAQKYIFPSAEENQDAGKSPDLLFCTGILPERDVTTPYVIDFEHISAIFNYATPTDKMRVDVIDRLLSEKCAKILPWSIAAQNTMLDLFPEKAEQLLARGEVLYPALPNYFEKYKDSKDLEFVNENEKLKLLFVGKEYNRKGLIEVLEALRGLDYNKIELHCISDMPKSEQKNYSDLPVTFYESKLSHEDIIKKFFITCDLFIMPTHEDTFGMVFLEALSCGLPVITTKQFASPEFITHGVNGFFVQSDILFLERSTIPDIHENGSSYRGVEEKLVQSIRGSLSSILENPEIVKEMAQSCYKDFEDGGKFSISLRSQKLEKIFKSV